MLISNLYYLTYCTNIHPGENWNVTFESLKTNLPTIKQRVAHNQDFGIGLRLSNKASEELGLEENLTEFKNWLAEHKLYVFTMNGFPYGNFHGEVVKDRVHEPDWTTKDRVIYTARLFKQLNLLVPKGVSGGISTSPISYKHWFKTPSELMVAKRKGADNMLSIALQLFQNEEDHGNYLHLDIEPEPDGILENSSEVLDFFNEFLLPQGVVMFQNEFGFEKQKAIDIIKRYITVCYDICHFSLAFEEPSETFLKFKKAGILVGKVQVSAALKILFDSENDDIVWDELAKFNEPTYLHQVTEYNDGEVKTHSDLPVVLKNKKSVKELRAHFHVPIFLEKFTSLYSTQDHIIKTVLYLKENQICNHLEIETYTWEVLPIHLKKELTESIVREIEWLKGQLT